MEKIKKIKSSKWANLSLKFLAFLFVFATGLLVFLILNAEKIINNNLSDFVYTRTDSIYRLEFDDINISYKNKSLSFSNVLLKPDPKLIENAPEKYVELETNILVISGIKIKQLLTNKIFHASSIKANNPKFKLATGQDVDIEMFSAQKFEIGDTIKLPFIDEVAFDTILVTDARMKIDSLMNPGRKVPKVNLEILDFKIGGIKSTQTPFPFDVADVSIKIENLHEKLSDHIHLLTVDEVALSLLHEKIIAKNIEIQPFTDSLVTDENQYSINVPLVEIVSPYVESFYYSDTVSVSQLTFQSPTIEIKFGRKIRKGTPLNQINLYKLIENDLAWINIDKFSIIDANLTLIPSKTNQIAQELEKLNIVFDDFRIDPTSYSDRNRVLSSKDVDISIGKFLLNHTDKVHQLVINNFKIETKNKQITTGSITFAPINTNNNVLSTIDALVNIRCKNASFSGVNFSEMYHHQVLPMNELLIVSPEVRVSLGKIKKKDKKENEVSLVFQKTKDYLKGIYVKRTVIEKGTLDYNYLDNNEKNGFFKTKFKFELHKLSIDSTTLYKTDKIFFANDFEINFSDIGLQLADNFHRLMTDSVLLSSQGKAARVYNLRIIPIKSSTSIDSLRNNGHKNVFDIHFPVIELAGADLHNAFFKKELSIEEFNVVNPSINIDFLETVKLEKPTNSSFQSEAYALISDYLFNLKIHKLRMKNGHLNINQYTKGKSPVEISNSFSMEMTQFEIDSLSSKRKNKIFFSDDADLVLKNYSFSLADGVHKVNAEEIGILSSKKRLYISNARLYPDLSAENTKNLSLTSFATLPSVEITGATIHDFFNNGLLVVNNVTFSKPTIKLLFKKVTQPDADSTNQPQFVLKGLKLFSSNKISINEGTIELANYSNMKSKTFGTSTIDLTVENLKIDNIEDIFKTNYTDLLLSMNNTSITIPEKQHRIEIKQANYRFSNKLLNIQDFTFIPAPQQGKETTSLYFSMPSITLSGFELNRFFEKKEIIVSSVNANSPMIEITGKSAEPDKKINPYRLQLYNEIKDFITKIEIGTYAISDASLRIYGDKTNQFDHLNISGSSFLVDQQNDKTERFLSSNFVRFGTSNLKGKTKDGFYIYSLGQIELDSKGTFSITNISLKPAYSEAEFNRRKIYQDDCITVNGANCEGNGFNIKRFVENGELCLSRVTFGIDNVEIYRNNHFPMNPNIVMKMPQQELREIKTKLHIDSTYLFCKKFNYRELEPQATYETNVFFTDVDAKITNLTNKNEDLKKDPYIHLFINTNLMGTGKMNAKLNMDIASPNDRFDLKAQCGHMPLNALNPITEPSLRLSIKEGSNNNMDLFFIADKDSSHGEMSFSYSGMKISLLSEKNGVVKEERFASFLINSLALKSDNPRPGKLIVPVPASALNDTKRSFINYCWRTAFSGLKNTFGLKEEEESKQKH